MADSYMLGLVKINLLYSGDQDTALNNFWALNSNIIPPTAAELLTFAESLLSTWTTNFAPLTQVLNQLTSVEVWDWGSATGATAITVTPSPGTQTSPPAGAQVAVLVNWPENYRYRGGHPRTFLPGVPTAFMYQNQFILDSYVAEYQGAAAAFQEAINGYRLGAGTLTQVAYHQRIKGVAPFTTPLGNPLVSDRLATIRRRVRRAGHRR
jgi:hypothetical protein